MLADDSGLEVYALGHRPGVLTAYYGGAGLSWSERRRTLIAELDAVGTPDRRARFVCALHFIDAGGRELAVFATVEGEIACEERGELGFSFDPVFLYVPAGRTFAELTPAEKNARQPPRGRRRRLVAAIRQAGIGRRRDAVDPPETHPATVRRPPGTTSDMPMRNGPVSSTGPPRTLVHREGFEPSTN